MVAPIAKQTLKYLFIKLLLTQHDIKLYISKMHKNNKFNTETCISAMIAFQRNIF